jgi:prevent-host-death family protein
MKSHIVGLAEAKNKLSELVDRVAQGEEITITRHDEAIAKLVPAKRPSRSDALRAVEQLFKLRDGGRDTVTAAEIKEWKETGRP